MSTVAKILVVLNLLLAGYFLSSASSFLAQQDNFKKDLAEEVKAHDTRNWNPPKKTTPSNPITRTSRGAGQCRANINANGTRTAAAIPLRKNATVTGSVCATRSRMATKEEPPSVVDRQAANAAHIISRRSRSAPSASGICLDQVATRARSCPFATVSIA